MNITVSPADESRHFYQFEVFCQCLVRFMFAIDLYVTRLLYFVLRKRFGYKESAWYVTGRSLQE